MWDVQDNVCDEVLVDINEEMSAAQLSSMGVTVLDNVLL